jgi:ribosomal protein L6P/L9E
MTKSSKGRKGKTSRTSPPRKIRVTVTIEESPTLEPNDVPSPKGFWITLNALVKRLVVGCGIEGLWKHFS